MGTPRFGDAGAMTRSIWVRMRQKDEEATASGIYGLIVSAAVMVTSHAETVIEVEIAVLVTLTVYWLAERFARIVAERIHEGQRPPWHTIRRQLTTGWEMITASGIPLIVLIAVRLGGAELSTAVLAGLLCTTLLLCLAGWLMGSNGRLRTMERVAAALVAGSFGAVLVILKTLLH
ncbi:hypothetical protein Aca07nite_12100 [Actinoplanes capillaceus]|uniref:Mn2+ efflux pump MntP n=2 Tax=Actinoplanes campanulatus TaxID=113559 RepID=A0ABQ3WC33_9ACTN|nr:hypothetical protein Aca07nite_12100 [Actinoplanes capillaceus]